jgi:signal transduction histidine kinase
MGTISRNLALLVLLSVLPALFIILYSGMEQRRQAIEKARQDVLLLTRSMLEVQKRIALSAELMLSTLAVTAEIQSLNPDTSTGVFKTILKHNPDYFNIALSDLNGRVLASGHFFSETNLGDRKHIQEALAWKRFAAGEYIVTRVGAHVPALAFAYPVLDPDENPIGVLSTVIGLDHFAGFYDVAGLPDDSFLAVTDHRGIRLFYHPRKEATNPVGRPIHPAVWNIVKNTRESGYFVHPGSDGIRRIVAYEFVSLLPEQAYYAIIWAGIPEAHILKAADRVLARNLLFLLMAVLTAVVISWLIGRHTLVSPINRLVAMTRRFASGDLSVRTDDTVGPRELNILVRAFDDMADALAGSHRTIQERETFIRTVLDNLPIGVAVNTLFPVVKFEYMNDDFPGIYRTTRDALAVPDAFWEAVYEDRDFRNTIRQRVLEDCAGGDPEQMRWEIIPIVRSGAGTRYVSARNTPIPDSPLMISLVWDVTEQKQADEDRQQLQAQLAQARKMESIGRLAGGVAHDFNNVVSIILGYAQLALSRTDPKNPLHQDLKEIETAALRSAELTRQLLAFARKQPAAPKVVDLNEKLNALSGMLRRLVGENIELVWQPYPDLWPVKMDPSQIDQIIMNLCVNAKDAIDKTGTISLSVDNMTLDNQIWMDDEPCEPGDYVRITVRDTGRGMDEKILANIFDPFFTTKEMGRGTGLGLAMVYGIVKQNKGFITVSSEPEQGAVFNVHLPRYAPLPLN